MDRKRMKFHVIQKNADLESGAECVFNLSFFCLANNTWNEGLQMKDELELF